jgi:hypothetical protein
LKISIKNIPCIVLLWLFIHPTGIQLLHHHDEEGLFHDSNHFAFHAKHSKCAVCNFHFSTFPNQDHAILVIHRTAIFEALISRYIAPPIIPVLSIPLLRGPPEVRSFS